MERLRAEIVGLALSLFACEDGELLGTIPDAAVDPGGPTLVTEVSDPTARDTDPTFTGDRLELYFMSDRAGSKDIWVSRRDSADEAWGAPTPVAELNSGVNDENPKVSVDGLTMLFYTDRNRALGTIWQSERASRDDAWGEPTGLSEITTGDGSSNVAAGFDESFLLLSLSARLAGTGTYDLYWFERSALGEVFEGPTEITELNSPTDDDFDPFLGDLARFVAFQSTRAGSADLFYSRREDVTAAFDPPEPMEGINSPAQDFAPALSPELDLVMFSSNRTGNEEIYQAPFSP